MATIVRIIVNVQENQRESPNLQVQGGPEEFANGERFWVRIASIFVESSDDECLFPLIEKSPCLVGLIWEINNENIANDRHANGDLEITT